MRAQFTHVGHLSTDDSPVALTLATTFRAANDAVF